MSSDQSDFAGSERFAIERRVGAGGFGVVYQAVDREHGTRVALKTLKMLEPEALYRFKREFRALQDVTHPNLVQLYELMQEGHEWFFTMEFVDGTPFLEYVRAAPSFEYVDSFTAASIAGRLPRVPDEVSSEVTATMTPSEADDSDQERLSEESAGPILAVGRLRSALVQLADGLIALHAADKLHRDIKPSNVLVSSEGRVVILDFGLVAELGGSTLASNTHFAGTPAYASPEQVAELPMTTASDLYSVGVMLYEALTGRRPFTGSPLKMLVDKQRLDALPPRDVAEGVPDDLNDLCVALLDRDPTRRPTALELRHLLGVAVDATDQRPPTVTARRSRLLVGREPQLSQLRDAFEATTHGAAVAVHISGRSGMGKSALLRRFVEDLQTDRRSTVILSGRCYERESVPYKALDSLVDALSQYLKRLPAGDTRALLPRYMSALTRLFPVLNRVHDSSESAKAPVEISDPLELRRRAFAALRELLARIADARPLVLAIDDVQWGDVDSVALLSDLLRPPDPPSLLLLLAYRAEDVESSPVLRALLEAQLAEDGAVDRRDVAVGELAPEDSRELAAALLGDAGGLARAETIARETAGNPFFIDELVRYARGSEAPAHVAAGGKEGDSLSLPQVISARVALLPEDARRLLELLAVAGHPVPVEVAVRAGELDGDPQVALAALRAASLVRSRRIGDVKELEPFHDRIRETVAAHLTAERTLACHLRLAKALESSEHADPEALAVHFRHGGEGGRASEFASVAADRAAEALAFDHAARLYGLALELRPDGTDGTELHVKLGDALANAGRGAEAARSFLDAAEGAGGLEALELKRRAAEQLMVSGHVDEGVAAIGEVMEAVGMRLPDSPRAALASLLLARARIRMRGLQFQERDAASVPREELLRVDVCWSIVRGLANVNPVLGAAFHARQLLLALKAGEPFRAARALATEVVFRADPGGRSLESAAAVLGTMRALAERIGHPQARAYAALAAGLAAYSGGRFRVTAEECATAETIFRERCTGVAWELDTSQHGLLRALVCLGRLRSVAERLPTLLKEARERGDLYAQATFRSRILYHIELAADDVAVAREGADDVARLWSNRGYNNQNHFNLVARVEIALYSGDGGAAWDLVAEKWPALSRSLIMRRQVMKIEAHLLRARASLAVADGARRAMLLASASRDAKVIERERTTWGAGLAGMVRGAVAEAEGRSEEAVALLEAAERMLDEHHMALHASAARRRRGVLVGGDEGRALVESADAQMRDELIRNPERMASMLAPGFGG